MGKWVVLVLALIVGGKMGVSYLLSDDFQDLADKKNFQWSCHLNNLMGNLHIVMSNYKEAHDLFERSLKRCPETSCGEEAAFKMAETLHSHGGRSATIQAYEKFLEAYPDSVRAKTARKAIDVLKHGF